MRAQSFVNITMKSSGTSAPQSRWKPRASFEAATADCSWSHHPSSEELSRAHRLRPIKIQVLEIVWAYLYSGRAKHAWQALQEFWPASDVERVRTEIMKAR